MTYYYISFCVAILLFCGLTLGNIWRTVRVALSVLLVVTLPFAMVSFLGLPKPLDFEFNVKDPVASVLMLHIEEGVAVYLVLKVDDSDDPVYYVIPWKNGGEEIAESSQKAMQESNARPGDGLVVRNLFDNSADKRKPLFYEDPQHANKPKGTD